VSRCAHLAEQAEGFADFALPRRLVPDDACELGPLDVEEGLPAADGSGLD
jgi:hypothetical protein